MVRHFFYRDALNPDTLTGAVVYGLFLLVVATAVAQFIRVSMNRLSRASIHLWRNWTSIIFLSQLAQLGVYIVAFIVYAHLIPALHSLAAALLTGASILTLVVGLGTQNILGNVAAGVSVLLYRPFLVGDTITVSAPTGHETGQVENISLSYTILITADQRRVNVPNSVIVSQSTILHPSGSPRP